MLSAVLATGLLAGCGAAGDPKEVQAGAGAESETEKIIKEALYNGSCEQ